MKCDRTVLARHAGRLNLWWIVLAALFVACVPIRAFGARPSPAMPPAIFPELGPWGVNVHSQGHAKQLKELGVQWVRLSVGWQDIEIQNRGEYDLKSTDELLQPYFDQGLKVLLLVELDKFSPLYREAVDKKDVDTLAKGFAGLFGAMAERYKGKGIVWELGNEPECFPAGMWNKPANYTKLARASARQIRAADPGAKVAAISAAWMDRQFIQTCLAGGLLADDSIDLISFHGYHRATNMPESGLSDDIKWLRSAVLRYSPRRAVGVIDSERGYYIRDAGEPRPWDNWKQFTTCESEQAAYLSRHYLEEIYNGIELSVWYKDFNGENSCSLFYDAKTRLRPMGHVYRNLAALLPENPTRMRNDQFGISLVDLDDKNGTPEPSVLVRSYLRTFASKEGESRRQQLIVAAWNPVESFEGKILQERKRVGEKYVESWRPVTPDDVVEMPTQIRIDGVKGRKIKFVSRYDLLSKATDSAAIPMTHTLEGDDNLLTPVLKIGPTPLVIVIELDDAAVAADKQTER